MGQVTYTDDVRDALFTAVVGDVLDELGRTRQFLPASIRPLQPHHKVMGRAMPVRIADVFGPNSRPFGRLTEALDQLEPGEVYLAAAGRARCAAWGEILTETSMRRGAVGAVLDSYHRDTAKILKLDWPVFSWGPYAQDAQLRTQVLDYRVPVQIGQVLVHPGDLVFGDIDGVVVVPAEIEAEVIELALQRATAENQVLESIRQGMSSTDAFAHYGIL